MKKIWIAIGMLVVIGTTPSAADESCTRAKNPLEQIFPGCKDASAQKPCVVTNSRGGINETALKAAEYVIQNNIRVAINGPCPSNCFTFADFARPQVCITKNAMFREHMMRQYAPGDLMCTIENGVTQVSIKQGAQLQAYNPPEHRPDIAQLIESFGGARRDYFLPLDYTWALGYWPACDQAVVERRQ